MGSRVIQGLAVKLIGAGLAIYVACITIGVIRSAFEVVSNTFAQVQP